jgi:hypothetical protein
VQLGWNDINSGAPRLHLYLATETNGGIGYLTSATIAAQQIIDYNNPIGEITPTNSLTLPASWFTNGLNRYFLFEAGAPGKGMLTLSIWQGTNFIAQTSAWLDFHDIKDLYEQAAITNVIQTWPEMVQQTNVSGFKVFHYAAVNPMEAKQLAAFVHGWRMTEWDYENFSDTMFKRLYWQGYQGRFASLRWPTRSVDSDTNNVFGVPADKLTFNRSEHIAFESGTGAAAYFNDLRSRYTNYTISAAAHSMGNIVMMEALKELAAANQKPLDNYVMMQAAVAAHCYDTTVTNLPIFTSTEATVPTPNTYANYAVGITNALRGDGRIANFFNTNDFALATGRITLFTVPFYGPVTVSTSWEGNESTTFIKPNTLFGYRYNPTNGVALVSSNYFTEVYGVTNLQTRFVTSQLELMPFVARPRSKAVGAQGGVGNIVNGGGLDLTTIGFTEADYDHSGQFNRNIQAPPVQPFYFQLRSKLFP